MNSIFVIFIHVISVPASAGWLRLEGRHKDGFWLCEQDVRPNMHSTNEGTRPSQVCGKTRNQITGLRDDTIRYYKIIMCKFLIHNSMNQWCNLYKINTCTTKPEIEFFQFSLTWAEASRELFWLNLVGF